MLDIVLYIHFGFTWSLDLTSHSAYAQLKNLSIQKQEEQIWKSGNFEYILQPFEV